MNLLMISGDRSLAAGKRGPFWQTLSQLHRHWDRIDILCPHVDPSAQKPVDLPPNVHLHVSPTGLVRQSGWIVRTGQRLARQQRYAVMTVHEYPPFYNGIGALRLAKKTGVPAVLEVHHIVGYPRAASWQEHVGRVLSRTWFPWAAQHAAAVRTVARSVADTLEHWGVPPKRVHVVPSVYLDLDGIAALAPPAAPQYDIAVCARLVPNKGIEAVLAAVARHPTATLLLIGDGPLRSTLERSAQALGIGARVTFTGWLPDHTDVLRAIASARMLVMNSSSEGGPRVVPEALACGVPVIVTDVGIMADVVTEGVNGIFTNGEPDDLHAKISRILDDTALWKSMSEQAPHSVEQFKRETAVKTYADFLKKSASAVDD